MSSENNYDTQIQQLYFENNVSYIGALPRPRKAVGCDKWRRYTATLEQQFLHEKTSEKANKTAPLIM